MSSRTLTLVLVSVLAVSSALAQTPPRKIAGDVVARSGAMLEVRTPAGSKVAVRLGDKTRIAARAHADLAQIVPGVYLGTTATRQPDGTLLASEVHVFPEAMRGVGEGHRPMTDVPGATMTNATVSAVAVGGSKPRSSMTNATVAGVVGGDHARRITLKYPGGEQVVVVPDNVPVVMIEPGDRSLLTPGAHVIVYATRAIDGALTAERVSVGKNGIVPPI